MDCHSEIKSIQYSSTAILANLFKLNDGILNEKRLTFFGLEKQQNLIKIMIEVMNEHQSDPLLLKNGLSILKFFDFTKIELVNRKYLPKIYLPLMYDLNYRNISWRV